jgi:hypothetical protein
MTWQSLVVKSSFRKPPLLVPLLTCSPLEIVEIVQATQQRAEAAAHAQTTKGELWEK